ncbi:hypothetical protein RFI_02464 [Reticulomyxa filosa]|uniref:Uncharacterized protein n=1 Tax=Reticulomyxa filosa TaxID=46433 RepID=X6P982_RETFI|nr:hypothetical protein RFI_02464 [Reticulomyxa filosa]|eukprot:ETO34624.1 hypothetical protein RFI_02464 [Reticulomyxa filosa]
MHHKFDDFEMKFLWEICLEFIRVSVHVDNHLPRLHECECILSIMKNQFTKQRINALYFQNFEGPHIANYNRILAQSYLRTLQCAINAVELSVLPLCSSGKHTETLHDFVKYLEFLQKSYLLLHNLCKNESCLSLTATDVLTSLSQKYEYYHKEYRADKCTYQKYLLYYFLKYTAKATFVKKTVTLAIFFFLISQR